MTNITVYFEKIKYFYSFALFSLWQSGQFFTTLTSSLSTTMGKPSGDLSSCTFNLPVSSDTSTTTPLPSRQSTTVFFFGVIFLILLKLILRQPFRKDYKVAVKIFIGWILFGAVSKWMAYLLENTGFTLGPSYGNIITQPA